MSKKHPWYDCIWSIQCHDKNGNLKWEDVGHNDLVDEGEESMLRTYFRNESSPSAFYLRLANQSIIETDNLVAITTEPTGTFGYSAQLIERSTVGWPTVEMDGGDYRVVSKLISFTASGGDIGPVSVAYLATTSDNTGKLIAAKNLPIVRTILDGDTGTVTLRVKLQ